MPDADPDPHDLNRFVIAQRDTYATALAELRAGRKQSHWMWFIFPQVAGLGRSDMAQRYAIASAVEAIALLQHPVLGPRLVDCARALLETEHRTAEEIMGYPDYLKLQSSMTLFARVAAPGSVFGRVLQRLFAGCEDKRTIEFLGGEAKQQGCQQSFGLAQTGLPGFIIS